MDSDKNTVNRGHGSPYDRGSADSWYSRSPQPHKWLTSCPHSRVELTDAAEIAEYWAGYNYNEEFGDKKEWD
jgi:hypothetical protein